jgi:P27 family predicted phage terminase small subunit
MEGIDQLDGQETAGKPSPPDWLDDVGLQKWSEYLSRLPDIQGDDADTLALLCASWSNYRKALDEIRDNGITSVGEKGRSFVNPACAVAAEERKTILKISKLFGLSPDPKARAAKAEASKFAGLLDG